MAPIVRQAADGEREMLDLNWGFVAAIGGAPRRSGRRLQGPCPCKDIRTNSRGHRTRAGARWGVGPLHKLITNPVYAGRMRQPARGQDNRRKAEADYVFADVPAIIPPPVFARVQALLKERNPRVTPPRVVTGPILLTGLAVCASCMGSMTLRTGTSRSGRVHRYYACSTCARLGKGACRGRSIRMDKLDSLVTNQLVDRLLQPERLRTLLSTLAERRSAKRLDANDGHDAGQIVGEY